MIWMQNDYATHMHYIKNTLALQLANIYRKDKAHQNCKIVCNFKSKPHPKEREEETCIIYYVSSFETMKNTWVIISQLK